VTHDIIPTNKIPIKPKASVLSYCTLRAAQVLKETYYRGKRDL